MLMARRPSRTGKVDAMIAMGDSVGVFGSRFREMVSQTAASGWITGCGEDDGLGKDSRVAGQCHA